MPLSFWDEAVRAAAFTINRLPSVVLHNKAPLQVLYNRDPDYSSLRVFGCACFPNIRPYNKNKLQFRSLKCTFLGYSLQHKGYKCLSPTDRLYISRDVLFNELSFPFSEITPSSSPSPHSSLSTSAHIPTVSTTTLPSPNPSTSNSISPSLPSSTSTTHSPSPTNTTPVISPTPPAASTLNTHPMTTRAKAGIHRPKILLAHAIPKSITKALQDEKGNKAINTEMIALVKNKTWSLVRLPDGRTAIGCKWVLRVKENADSSVDKLKARLVAKGFSQEYGFDYTETFSPVVKPTTIRIMLTVALSKNWPIKQLDVNNAFLNGELSEEVYMLQPPGFVDPNQPHLVCKLHKALYGLKQAPRAWFDKLRTVLLSLGFVCSKADNSLFLCISSQYIIFVFIYVDDILVTENSATAIDSLVTKLHTSFALKDLGEIAYFLGIHVHHTSSGLHLSQKKYIQDLLSRVNMQEANSLPTPMPGGEKLSAFGSDAMSDPYLYRSTVGTLHTEAEYRSLANATAEIMWIQSLLSEIDLHLQQPPTIWCDNQSTVLMSANPVLHSRTKHIELDLYFVRERILSKQLIVKHTPAHDQIADILTKAVSSPRFPFLRDKLSLASLAQPFSLRGVLELSLKFVISVISFA
uniref:Reverse transcriptase Ty1/copia-type domain-containing protein n=1 Tax=Cannabis sativa TaxID=3483 RepID=A0A803P493_CANSA